MKLKDLQASLTHWVLDPDAKGAPKGVRAIKDLSGEGGATLYRNSILEVEIKALEITLPTVLSLVGDKYFRAVAKTFLRSAKPAPNAGNLDKIGNGFPAFLPTCEGAANTPYISEVAQLDLAIQHADEGPDPAPLDKRAVRALQSDPDELTLRICPNATLLSCQFPVDTIRQAYLDGFKAQLDLTAHKGATRLIVWRRDRDVELARVNEHDWALLKNINGVRPFTETIALANNSAPDIDISAALTNAITNRWVEPVL